MQKFNLFRKISEAFKAIKSRLFHKFQKSFLDELSKEVIRRFFGRGFKTNSKNGVEITFKANNRLR